MRSLVPTFLLLGALLTAPYRPAEAEEPARPNIIFFIADDMAWDDCGPFGHRRIQTPNLDRLAEQGICFDNAMLTTSSCSPSRSSIITGRYPHNTDAEELHWPLPGEQVTFVEQLKASGYWTAAAGKWHLGNAVLDRFDEVRGADTSGFQLPTGADAEAAKLLVEGDGAAKSGCAQWVPVLQDRPRDRPFFLWLAAIDPHRDYEAGIIPEPHTPEDVVVPPYLPDTPEVRRDLALYYDEITRLDQFVGLVLKELEHQGETDNTLVLFLSDNGRPFPRDKTTVYDSGVKTPWILRWPGHVEPGTRQQGLVSVIDIAPTFLKLAGLEPGPTFQGVDFSPMLFDPEARVREHAFAERNWHDYRAFARAVRTEKYRYIWNPLHDLPMTPPADAVRSPTFREMRRLRDAGLLPLEQQHSFLAPRPEEELYDVEADPHEMNNLAGDPAHAKVLAELRAVLQDWREATDDEFPGAEVLSADEFDRETGDPRPNRERPRRSKADRG